MLDHREPPANDMAGHYAPSHTVKIRAGGALAALYSGEHAEVNSLHQQGIDRLAPGLEAEAWAPDGLVEAVSVRSAAAFALAVQWHPEWRPKEHPFYDALFQGFATACRQHRTNVPPSLLSAERVLQRFEQELIYADSGLPGVGSPAPPSSLHRL
ncbi:hypothetical protein HORIV_63050 [Vreelandella olivaria]|uniref:Uncharacterized protein n=1 Tax=Vreelandella olivaria TaxID=390919 RepID=A0ABM7GSY2_9GAMM|nr:hypothetical protein HORIV_63050 [Halomonas olivaria]